jgi:plasmid maintenance system antidote protein VapI
MAGEKKSAGVSNPCAIVREEMDKRFLNQDTVARGLGVTAATVLKILKKDSMSLKTALLLEKYFKFEKHYLADMKAAYELSLLEKEAEFKEAYQKVTPWKPVKAFPEGKSKSGGTAGKKQAAGKKA